MRLAFTLVPAVAALFGATEIPSITPQVSSVFPHGGRRGTEVAVELRGNYLDAAREVRFLDDQVSAAIESSTFRSIRARIRIAPDAEPGRHDFRVLTPRGVWLGVFEVGTLAESFEVEPNNRPAQAQPLTFPSLINGRADGADADYFRFHAEAGQTMVFDVTATRLGSGLDPVLTIFDERGRELAYNDDAYAFKDARLVHTFSRAGEYTVLLSASFERSARDAEYRLLATSGPYAASSLPLGARRGATTEILVRGWNLDKVDRITLGRNLAEGRILDRRPNELRFTIDVPATASTGSSLLHFSGGAAPLRFEISDLAEVTLSPAHQPFRVTPPIIVNGEIRERGDRIRRVQSIEFDVRAGARYEFRADAWKLGQLFDPVVTLIDPSGRAVAQEDDPAPNSFIHHPATHDPRLVYVFPAAGRYRLTIHDAAYEASAGYRLTIRDTRPDFELEVRSPLLTVFAGRSARLLAVVRRTGGAHQVQAYFRPDSEVENFRLVEKDGWNTPIKVWAEGLPDGVTAGPMNAEPHNTTFKGNDGEELFVDGTLVEIPIQAREDVRPGLYEIAVRAQGSFEGREVERRGTVLYSGLRSLRGEPTPDQKLYLNVIDAPPLLWNSPPEFRLSKGRTDHMKVGIVRLDGSYPVEVQAKSSLAGWTVGRSVATATAEEIEVPVTAPEDGKDPPAELVLVATFQLAGRTERVESPPIALKVKP